jgi:transcriptional regulator with XRE-family HTH domain
MDDIRVGRILRALRLARGLRQRDVAEAAHVAQATVSMIERGHWTQLSAGVVRRVFAVVEARFEAQLSWRGGALDRLLDEGYASVVGTFATILRDADWEIEVEVTYAHFGERGSIDILAIRPNPRIALAVEVKAELASIEETIRRLDEKTRLCGGIVQERFGWQPVAVSRLLVIREGSTARRRIARHGTVLEAAFPARGAAVRPWLRTPVGQLSGLILVPVSTPRVRR